MPPTATASERSSVAEPPFSRDALAQRWGVSTRSIDAWIGDGRLRAVKLVHQVRIPHSEVMRAEREGIRR